MEFGIPKVRQALKEKYENNACLTFLPTGEKLGRKVVFNKKAIDELMIVEEASKVSFSFSGNEIFLVNTTGCDNCAGLKVGKISRSFADKKHYEHIKTKIFNTPNEDELELFLEPTDNLFDGRKVFKLVRNFANDEPVDEVHNLPEVFNGEPEMSIEVNEPEAIKE